MPKRRKNRENSEERCLRKYEKYKARLSKRRRYDKSAESEEHSSNQNPSHEYILDSDDDTQVELPTAEAQAEIRSNPEVPLHETQPEPPTHETLPELPMPHSETQNDIVLIPQQIDESIYDEDILRALGSFETEEVAWGKNIHQDIGKRVQFILQNGLKKEIKEELNKKYLFPENAQFTKAPTLNPEMNSMLSDANRNRDKLLMAKQNQLGKALSALGAAMTVLVTKDPDIKEAVRSLNDCVQLLADSHYSESYTRRSVIIPLVDKYLVDPLKETKRDHLLFGEKLPDLVKNSKGIKKTGNMIQASSSSTSNLNWKGSANRGRYKPPQHYRGASRRRYPPAPPPIAPHVPARRGIPSSYKPYPAPPPTGRLPANNFRRPPFNKPPQ